MTHAAAKLDIRLKRAYLPPSPEDGVRVLVDRLWPPSTDGQRRWRRARSSAAGSLTTRAGGKSSVADIEPNCRTMPHS
jgi:hypothetical protein